jgi:hypothetical protein
MERSEMIKKIELELIHKIVNDFEVEAKNEKDYQNFYTLITNIVKLSRGLKIEI